MYTTKITNEKKEAVQAIKAKCSGVGDIVFTDYRGLSVAQITALRTKLRGLNSDYHVVKNRYVRIAFQELNYPEVDGCLVGPTAIALVRDESGPVTKELFAFTKDTSLAIKGGLIDGKLFNSEEIEVFSKLPTRLELIAKLMGTANAPVQNFVYALNAVTTKLVRTLHAVAEKKSGE